MEQASKRPRLDVEVQQRGESERGVGSDGKREGGRGGEVRDCRDGEREGGSRDEREGEGEEERGEGGREEEEEEEEDERVKEQMNEFFSELDMDFTRQKRNMMEGLKVGLNIVVFTIVL